MFFFIVGCIGQGDPCNATLMVLHARNFLPIKSSRKLPKCWMISLHFSIETSFLEQFWPGIIDYFKLFFSQVFDVLNETGGLANWWPLLNTYRHSSAARSPSRGPTISGDFVDLRPSASTPALPSLASTAAEWCIYNPWARPILCGMHNQGLSSSNNKSSQFAMRLSIVVVTIVAVAKSMLRILRSVIVDYVHSIMRFFVLGIGDFPHVASQGLQDVVLGRTECHTHHVLHLTEDDDNHGGLGEATHHRSGDEVDEESCQKSWRYEAKPISWRPCSSANSLPKTRHFNQTALVYLPCCPAMFGHFSPGPVKTDHLVRIQ